MFSDLDAKGPHVQSNEHNPERDIPFSTQAALHPSNDPSGLAERLLQLAQQFRRHHAPMHITMLLREAANMLSNHRTETLDYLGQVGQLSEELERLRAALRAVMVGGNHLATIIGATHPLAGTHFEGALEFYGTGHQYDAWCCWNAIMEARAVLEERT